MNNQGLMRIVSHQKLIENVYEMVLEGEAASYVEHAGQFINIKLTENKDPYLRRPMSICDYNNHEIKLIYKVVGEGTRILSKKKTGDILDVLTGLGNGFIYHNEKEALLIGGGLGVPPLYKTCKDLINMGVKVKAILGFNSVDDVFYQKEFEALCPVYISTMDGSLGIKGTVIDCIKKYGFTYDHYYACGPLPMLKALASFDNKNGSLSYEARMGCGFGACMGCSMLMKDGTSKRICVEGPVFSSSEVQ